MRAASPPRRLAAATALAVGAVALGAALVAMVEDPEAGLLVLPSLTLAAWLAWRGAARGAAARARYLVGAAVLVAAGAVVFAVRGDLLAPIVVALGAGVVATTVRVAFGRHGSAGGAWQAVDAPRRPVLLINPRSGDGKAARVALAEHARACGVEPTIMEAGDDLVQLARQAIAGGADALGMAGGDGSQGLIAAIAAAHELPFVCVPAGTRNHLALDLGVDRFDPVGALEGFTHGVERRIDLGEVNARTFVNNVSLGLYGDAVQRPGYRTAKLRTLLEALADVLHRSASAPPVQLIDDVGQRRTDATLVLISNNPYALDHTLGRGTRPTIDSGQLGVVLLGRPGVHPERSRAWTAQTLEVGADGPVPAAIDGEAVTLEPPLRFRIRPATLRVRISARHPGLSPSALLPRTPAATVTKLARIAAGRG